MHLPEDIGLVLLSPPVDLVHLSAVVLHPGRPPPRPQLVLEPHQADEGQQRDKDDHQPVNGIQDQVLSEVGERDTDK